MRHLFHSLRLVLMLALALTWGQALAQDVEVRAFVDATTVGEDETLTFTLEVHGASFSDVERPSPPETEGLALENPYPSTQRNITFVNGTLSQSVAFQWTYRPVRTGTAHLKPLRLTVKGRSYETDAIRVEVVAQSQRTAHNQRSTGPNNRTFGSSTPNAPSSETEASSRITAEELFIRAIPSDRSVYQNEQLVVEYQLFFRNYIQPRHSRLADSWDAEGFWREELDVESRPIPRSVVEGGLRYNVITIKRVAVFPTRAGRLTVDPLRIETEVFAPHSARDPFGSFLSLGSPYETVERASPAVMVDVRPLPDGAPVSFTGSVGRFDMQATVNRTEVDVGEPVEVEVRLSGTGNLALIEPPPLRAPGVFEVYDPQIATSINTSGRRVRGSKTFTYVLVPRSPGTFELPPVEFSYLDPESGQYRTLSSDPVTLRVTGSAEAPVAPSTTPAGLPVDDIAPPLTESAWTRIDSVQPHEAWWAYVLLLLPLAVLGGMYAYRRFTHRLATDTAYARYRRAHPVARRHLRTATSLLEENRPAAFYEELERAVLGFAGNRLNVAERGLTRPQLDEHLALAGVSEDVREQLLRFLELCDQGRFAPVLPSRAQMTEALDQAHRLIVTLDQAFFQHPSTVA